jgi:hypothetical protein
MTYNRTRRGLGGAGDPIDAGDLVTLIFTPVAGLTAGEHEFLLTAIKVAVQATNLFQTPLDYLGWGAGGNAGKLVLRGAAKGSAYSLQTIANGMPAVTQAANVAFGKRGATFYGASHGSDTVTVSGGGGSIATPGTGTKPKPSATNPALPHPYATMTICDAQRRLIAAGKSIDPDGKWGGLSHGAFLSWATSRPASEQAQVHPSGLPAFGSREDYKKDGTSIRLPAAYVASLPTPATIACRSTAPRPPTAPADPTLPDGEPAWSPGTGESVTLSETLMAYGPWVALAAVVAGGGGYWWWKRKHRKAV